MRAHNSLSVVPFWSLADLTEVGKYMKWNEGRFSEDEVLLFWRKFAIVLLPESDAKSAVNTAIQTVDRKSADFLKASYGPTSVGLVDLIRMATVDTYDSENY